MFSSKHAIWKFAYAGDELDDWLPYAEDLIRKWSSQNSDEVEFQTTFEIIVDAVENPIFHASCAAKNVARKSSAVFPPARDA